MELTLANCHIEYHGVDNKYRIHIDMPDGSRNFIHTVSIYDTILDAILVRELLIEQSIDHMNLEIKKIDRYYMIWVSLKWNDEDIIFHSRKLNLHDVIYERDILINSDE